MSDRENFGIFGNTAQGLAKNPLGIIALFIVLVYGLASMVVIFGSSMTPYERVPIIYFLIIFPIIVFGVFTWLVHSHGGKLFAPGDFKDESNYVKMQLSTVASLSAATVKESSEPMDLNFDRLVEMVQVAVGDRRGSSHIDHILWVDDRPDNNIYERRAFESVGFRFTLALSTDEAFQKLAEEKFSAIISDMGRAEGPREGYVLLDKLRQKNNYTPLFFYASSNSAEHKKETADHGGQGCTNNPQELFQMVTRAVIQQRTG